MLYGSLVSGPKQWAVALERLASLEAPARPATPGDWVTVMRLQAQQVEGQHLTTCQAQAFATLQRQVATRLTQGYRSDPSPDRTDTYASHLMALGREGARDETSAISDIPGDTGALHAGK